MIDTLSRHLAQKEEEKKVSIYIYIYIYISVNAFGHLNISGHVVWAPNSRECKSSIIPDNIRNKFQWRILKVK